MVNEKALEIAAERSYRYEGDRKRISYVGWENEPEDVRSEWRESVRQALLPYLAALSPGSTGSAEVTEAMIEAGHEAALAWTDRYMDGSEFVNWQQGLPDIYRAMIDAAGGR